MPDGTSIVPVITKYVLETIFTPPAWCTSSFYTYHSFAATRATESYFARAESAGNGAFDQALKDCYPPHFSTFNNIFSAQSGVAIYSPGVCPSAWTQVTELPPPYPTSQYICCPVGFEYHTKGRCTKQGSIPTTVALNPSKNITISPPYALLDWPIRIGWASSDLSKFSPVSAPLVEMSYTAAPSPGSSGLSTGAKAGIGVGIAAAVVLLICLIVGMLLLRKRRQQREQEEDKAATEELTFEPKSAVSPPPGYDSRLASRGASSDAAMGNNREWYSAAEKRGEEPAPSPLGTSSPSSGPSRTTNELDGTPRTFSELPDSPQRGELDSSQVYEAPGREISRNQVGLSSVAAHTRTNSGGLLPDMRSGSPSLEPFRQGSSMAGRWSDYNPDQAR